MPNSAVLWVPQRQCCQFEYLIRIKLLSDSFGELNQAEDVHGGVVFLRWCQWTLLPVRIFLSHADLFAEEVLYNMLQTYIFVILLIEYEKLVVALDVQKFRKLFVEEHLGIISKQV